MLRRSIRVCEECGTERRITLLEQAVTTTDGQVVIGLFGEARCQCPSYALDELDLQALDNSLKENAADEEDDELDVDEEISPALDEILSGSKKKPRSPKK